MNSIFELSQKEKCFVSGAMTYTRIYKQEVPCTDGSKEDGCYIAYYSKYEYEEKRKRTEGLFVVPLTMLAMAGNFFISRIFGALYREYRHMKLYHRD